MYPPYLSRISLIDCIFHRLHSPCFFIPFQRKCYNDDTFTGENTDDYNIFMVAYGTLFNYRCYELKEFIMNFKKEGATVWFRNPENPKILFKDDKVKELLILLKRHIDENHPSSILDTIEEGLNVPVIKNIEELEDYFKTLEDEDKKNILKYLHKVFEIGMYTRTWKGPGYGYPMKIYEAYGKEQDFIITEEFINLHAIEEVISHNGFKFIRSIPYFSNFGDVIHGSLYELLSLLEHNEFCIKEGNNLIIKSSSILLKKLYNKSIPYFELNKMDLTA